MPDLTILNWIVQGGSFALVVAIFVYLGYVLIPKTLSTFERMTVLFDGILQRTENRHAAELVKRDDKIVASLDKVTERLTRLEARSEEWDRGRDPEQAPPARDAGKSGRHLKNPAGTGGGNV